MKTKPTRGHFGTSRCLKIKDQITDAAGSHTTRAKPNPQHALDALNDLAIWHNDVAELMQTYVNTARKQGFSWAQIGGAMSMTKGSAQQRFGKPAAPSADAS